MRATEPAPSNRETERGSASSGLRAVVIALAREAAREMFAASQSSRADRPNPPCAGAGNA